MTLELKKDDKVKYIDKESRLLARLKADGWLTKEELAAKLEKEEKAAEKAAKKAEAEEKKNAANK